MHDPQELYDAVISGDADLARSVTEAALKAGTEPLTLVNLFMQPAMDEVGRRFDVNDFFVPELLRSARAMKTAMALLRPLLAARGNRMHGRVVIGTVAGDVHDIGKNLVAAVLEGGGFEVMDLGSGVPVEAFIAAAAKHQAHIVGMSALLTTTMSAMKTTIEAFTQAELRDRVKILVGGAPVTAQFAQEIGADGFSNGAAGVVALARLVLGLQATPPPGVYLCAR